MIGENELGRHERELHIGQSACKRCLKSQKRLETFQNESSLVFQRMKGKKERNISILKDFVNIILH